MGYFCVGTDPRMSMSEPGNLITLLSLPFWGVWPHEADKLSILLPKDGAVIGKAPSPGW